MTLPGAPKAPGRQGPRRGPCPSPLQEEYTCKFMKKARTLKITLHKDMEGALD